MKELTKDIDLDAEAQAIARHIARTWTPIENLEEMVFVIREHALTAARAWLDRYKLSLKAHELEEARRTQLELSAPGSYLYDAVCHMLGQVSHGMFTLHEAAQNIDGKWDYSRRVDALVRHLLVSYPQLKGARPLGWDKLAENYVDFDGQQEYDPKPDMDAFDGTRVEGPCSSHLPYRSALPYVMYDEVCQGRKAHAVLVGAIFAQFLGIQEFLNGVRAEESLEAYVAAQPAQMVFSLAGPAPTNPHLQVLLKLGRPTPTEAEWQEAQRARREWQALSEDERAARSRGRDDTVARLLAELGREPTEAEKKEKKEQDDKFASAMREAFPA